MKLRIARKIWKAMGTPAESRYSGHQIRKAVDRVERTRTSKELDRWWSGVVRDVHDAAARGEPVAVRLLENSRRAWERLVKGGEG